MTLKDKVGDFISGISISIKRLLTYNRAIKVIDRKAYAKGIEEEYSLLIEIYSNPLFAQLLDFFSQNNTFFEKEHKRENSVLTETERSIANFYLIWKEENESKSLDNSAVE